MGWEDNDGIPNWSLSRVPDRRLSSSEALMWLPDWRSIAPTKAEAKEWQCSGWGRYVSRIFFSRGGPPKKIKKGVKKEDASKAWRVVEVALRSYAPSHEHKISSCAWILDQYYEFPGEDTSEDTIIQGPDNNAA